MSVSKNGVVVVTGSSGFIGAALVSKLAEHYHVVGFDRGMTTHPPAVAECVCVDLTSDSSIAAGMQRLHTAYGTRIASVLHLAAYFDLTGEPNPLYETVTVRGTERLLHAFREFELEQFIFFSTMLVHAPTRPGEPINEDSPFDEPRFPYRASKQKTERLLREQHGATPIVLVRPAGIYDDLCHSAFLAEQIARIYEKQWLGHVYSGDVDTGQPYLHLDDLLDAIVRLVERRAELPKEFPLLLAESEAPSYRQLQHDIECLVHGKSWPTREMPKGLARSGAWLEANVLGEEPFVRPWMVDSADDHYEIDMTRVHTRLGWSPQRNLRKTLPSMIDALKKDPVGWYRANKLDWAKVAAHAFENRQAKAAMDTHSAEGKCGEGKCGDGKPGEGKCGEGKCGAVMNVAKDKSAGMAGHMQQMRQQHFAMLWVHYLNFLLGAWLLASPFVLGSFNANAFSESVLRVTVERHLWEPALRRVWLADSDLISGALIMLFAICSLTPRLAWAQWANAALGTWLLFAPLLFWVPDAAVYANDTLVGALVIAFAILVPMMPGMSMAGMMDASDLPPGWTYSPSTYLQRLPIIALGAVGFLIARHLAAYQLGHIDAAWDPFFAGAGGHNGTETIITSSVSKAWPVPDAGLGATVYLFEILMGAMGGRERWRTMPWMVMLFGILVVPLGVVSIYFIIIQPIVIGTWCTLCLIAAAAMLIMIPYSLDELVAMGQFLTQSSRRGEPFWRSFFKGGPQPYDGKDAKPGFDAPLAKSFSWALTGGITFPWTLLAVALLGTSLTFTRLIFGTQPPMADSDHLVGALIVTMAVLAMAEVTRSLRLINIAFGLWLIAAPWLLSGHTTAAAWSSVIIGVAVAVLSLPRGKRSAEHYGYWDRFIV